MMYLYESTISSQEFLVISELLPPAKAGIALLGLSAIVSLAFLGAYRRLPSGASRVFQYFIPCIAFSGMYIYTLRWVDEVFINLEHPWNLWHFGRFSFDPTRMVDGTVEVVYYLALTPFAYSRESLVIANLVFAWVLGVAHILVIFKLFSRSSPLFQMFAGVLFSLWWPVVCVLSNGFGTGLPSLLFLWAIYYLLQGNRERYLFIAAILPLIRLDAIAYSAALFFVDLVLHREFRWRSYAIAVVSVFASLFVFRSLYGHWVPTPVAFKSFNVGMLPYVQFNDFLKIVDFLHSPLRFIALVVAIAGLCLCRSAAYLRIALLLIPMVALFVFYTLSGWNPIYDGRYYFGYEMLLLLIVLIVLERIVNQCSVGWNEPNALVSKSALSANVVCATGTVLVLISSTLLTVIDYKAAYRYTASMQDGWRPYFSERVDGLAVGGQILGALIPGEWSISATEMNAFGYMIDRPVIDLWGYTNPSIAKSIILSPGRIRNAPDFFLSEQPCVHWHRTSKGNLGHDRLYNYANFEGVVVSVPNIGRKWNQLGDIVSLLNAYDVVFMKTSGWETSLLVRKDLYPQLAGRLEADGYRLVASRRINSEALQAALQSNN
jgi:hypothetical protein